MPQTILLTAAKEDSAQILDLLKNDERSVVHAPLEVYIPKDKDAAITGTFNALDDFQNIVYSSTRNAQFFLEKVEEHDKLNEVKNCLNLVYKNETFTFLEGQGISAVCPPNAKKPIDLVELMLRLQRLGSTLYPCGSHQREDFPGFLEELDIPVTELDLFDLEGPDDGALAHYQQQVIESKPDGIIFHSRRSVNRTLAAFPELDYGQIRLISADRGITNKLEEKNISVDVEAEGSWQSVGDLI